jgi:hypothetical protein
MAYSMKKMGKEVGPASVYAQPHDMTGKTGVDLKNAGYQGGTSNTPNNVRMSVGNLTRDKYPEPKTTGIKVRGTGAATKGLMARGPMA